jgi:hypothetical protein
MQRLSSAIIVASCLALALLILILCSQAQASTINDKDAVRAIMGEASGEGLKGMRAVASAIRNRGHLRGVYGLKAKHVDNEPAWVWKLARQAWEDSEHFDYANGADHWEGTAFKVPYWAKDMDMVKHVGNQKFYKARR